MMIITALMTVLVLTPILPASDSACAHPVSVHW
jgi:hypothetical protein